MLALAVGTASAADKVRVGKSVSQPFAFAPVEIGAAEGIWAKHDLDVETVIFAGDAKLQQGMVANAVDFGLGSGPAMGFLAKGVPAKAVGALANEPLSMGLIVGADSPIQKPQDLKGRKIGVTTNGSLTYWLARELSRQMGWGSERHRDRRARRHRRAARGPQARTGRRRHHVVVARLWAGENRRRAAACSSSAPTSRISTPTSSSPPTP